MTVCDRGKGGVKNHQKKSVTYFMDGPLYYYCFHYYIIPEQFTVKAHPALFEGREGRLLQCALLLPNCESSHSVRLLLILLSLKILNSPHFL